MNKTISTPLAISIIVALSVMSAAGLLWYMYYPSNQISEIPQFENNGQAICTQEAKLCSDGSYVGRTGPNCEFAQCPENKLVCKESTKYFVISTEDIIKEGTDFLVKYKAASADQNIPCSYSAGINDFEIKNKYATYFLALTDNFLVLDSGTAPPPRGISIYNLNSRKEVYSGLYSFFDNSHDISASGDVLTYWEPTDKAVTIENCPEMNDWISHGLGAGIEALISFDLSTLTKKELGQYRCSARQ